MQNENLTQAMNAAYASEFQGVKLYENLKDKDPIFAQILAIKNSGLALVGEYRNDRISNVPCYFDSSNKDTQTCLIKALNYEIELNDFYETLTENIDDENLRDICFRLWATSHNEYIPALKARLCEELGGNKNLEYKEYAKSDDCDDKEQKDETANFGFNGFDQNAFKKMSETIERIASGRGTQEDIAAVLNSPHFSFFGGLAVGGLAGIFINKFINKEEDKKDV